MGDRNKAQVQRNGENINVTVKEEHPDNNKESLNHIRAEINDLRKQNEDLRKRAKKNNSEHKDSNKSNGNGSNKGNKSEKNHDAGNGIELFYIFIYIILVIDAFAFNYAISPAILSLRFAMYFLVSLWAYFLLKPSLEHALRTYTLLSLGQIFFAPILLQLFSVIPVPDIVTGNITLAVMLFPWWVVYLQVNGYYWKPKPTKNLMHQTPAPTLGQYISRPSLWPKTIYTVLIIFVLINATFSVAGHPAMEYLETEGINPSEGIYALGTIISGAFESTWNNVVVTTSKQTGIGNAQEIDPNSDNPTILESVMIRIGLAEPPEEGEEGNSYRSQVERDLYGVETDIDIPIRGSLTTAEGREYQVPVDITFDSIVQESNLSTTCILANKSSSTMQSITEEDIVYEEVLEKKQVGGSRSTLFTEFCDIPNDVPPGEYTFFAVAEFPFTTQAATTYYFASSDLFTANRERYLSEVQRLNAENVKAVHSTGGATVATDSRDQQLVPDRPILLDKESSQQFRYGFSLIPGKGNIDSIENIEMHIPQGLRVDGCTVSEGGTREKRSVYESYQVDPESLLTSSNGVKYTFCSLEYDTSQSNIDEIYDFFIPSENRVNDVTMSIYADYTYQLETSIGVTVPEPRDTNGAEEDTDGEQS